jgi:hypothetical protein
MYGDSSRVRFERLAETAQIAKMVFAGPDGENHW